MPYKRMKLRGAEVFARVDESGELETTGGRVEIRYSRTATKAYRASPKNLTSASDEILPDDYVASVDASPAAAGRKRTSKSKPPSSAAPPTEASEGETLFYADGACTGNPGPAGLGVVRLETDARFELSEFLGDGTNNIAELTAIQRAAEAVEFLDNEVRIFTDSKYSIGVLTQNWKAKKNKELILNAKAALARLPNVTLVHVKGHAGFELNEKADELAVLAVKSRESTGWVTVE